MVTKMCGASVQSSEHVQYHTLHWESIRVDTHVGERLLSGTRETTAIDICGVHDDPPGRNGPPCFSVQAAVLVCGQRASP